MAIKHAWHLVPMKSGLSLLFVTMLCATQTLHAQSDAVLDLQFAIDQALAGNPSLRAAGIQRQLQEARIEQAGIKPRPELMIEVQDVFGSGVNDLFNGVEATATVSWILEGELRGSRLGAARAGSSLVEADIAIRRMDVAAETAKRYLESLELQSGLTIALEGIELGEAAVNAITERVNAGTAPAAELARARADLRRLEMLVENYEHELLSANYRLAAQWGNNEPDFTAVIGNLLDFPAIDSVEDYLDRLDQNPDLERFLTVERVQQAQLSLEQALNRQPWKVGAGFRWQNINNDHGFVGSLTIPLGPQDTNRGRVAEARARISQSQMEREAERLRLRTDVFVIYQELLHNVDVAAAFVEDIIPLYEAALEDTQTAYEAGLYSYLEWSQTQLNLLNARYELIETAHSLLLNLIEIQRLTGVPPQVSGLSQ